MSQPSVIIIGAGPVGLTAAIECARAGMDVTVLERNAGPTDESRAVGVNRQSLMLLEPSGAAASILAEATPLRRAVFYDGAKRLAELEIPQASDGAPTMVLLAQSETECLLLRKLEAYGVRPRWNAEVRHVQQNGAHATATLICSERIDADYILGADGARSHTRRILGLNFPGEQYEESWSLMDAALDWPFPGAQAAPFFSKDGAVLFVIEIGKGIYRAISNRPDIEEDVARRFFIKSVYWKNDFTVSLRAVDRYGEGRIWIAGDAAHIHSPVGGMGMNLGIEDACDFAATLAGSQDFEAFDARRIAAAKRVLALSDRGYRFASATHPVRRFARNAAIRTVANVGFIRRMAGRQIFRAAPPELGGSA